MDDELLPSRQCSCPQCALSANGFGQIGAQFAATGNYRLDALLYPDTNRWNDMALVGTPVPVSYSFSTTAPSDATDQDARGFEPMNETQKAGARAAFATWEAVTNIRFVEVSAVGDIRLGTNVGPSGSAAYAYRPAPGTGGDVYLNNSDSMNQDMTSGSAGFTTIVHEIGHAIGLKHPGNYNGVGGSGTGPFLPTAEDNVNNTVMSYTNFGSPYPSAPRPYDIEAAQYLYGVKRDTGIVYSQSGDILATTGSTADDALIGINQGDVIAGGVGNDSIFGRFGNDAASGGPGNDLVYGNQGTDLLYGEAGNDVLFGGQNGGELSPGETGVMAYRDGFDTLYGDDGNDVIYGNHGPDFLFGGEGNDTLFGGQDADRLDGGVGRDVLYGNLGSDTLYGGQDADVFVFGGSGVDVVSDFNPSEDHIRGISFSSVTVASIDGGVAISANGLTMQLLGISSVTPDFFLG